MPIMVLHKSTQIHDQSNSKYNRIFNHKEILTETQNIRRIEMLFQIGPIFLLWEILVSSIPGQNLSYDHVIMRTVFVGFSWLLPYLASLPDISPIRFASISPTHSAINNAEEAGEAKP